jgi:YggT family protein
MFWLFSPLFTNGVEIMIRFLLMLYILLLVVDFVVSMFAQFRQTSWAKKIHSFAEPTCAPVRSMMPKDVPVDFSHFIVIFIILLIMRLW